MEMWKPVVGYPELFGLAEVSDQGRVRTLDSERPSKRAGQPSQLRKGCTISPWVGKNGYQYVQLKVAPKRTKYLVHRLVGRAFVPGYFESASIDHINGNKVDNRAQNLEWVTLAHNTKRQWQTGLVNIRGENHPSAKLTDDQTRATLVLRRGGMTQRAIADMFGVSRSLICKIEAGKKKVK